ncbi:MAG: calcium/sodium antiporter [Planctomycetaceae bacterium]|nr:calcium/sodium antiporter [Planctomycetaceae bacterium]
MALTDFNWSTSILDWILVGVGLIVLTIGAELLVRGASRLAIACRISPLVVGLTVVAFGTSAPELVVSVQSSLTGQADVALGNVIGSNILNVLLILGLSALIVPLVVSQQLVRIDVPLMVVVSMVAGGMAWHGGAIGRTDGILLNITLVTYTIWMIRKSRSEQQDIQDEYAQEFGAAPEAVQGGRHVLINILLLVAGMVMLVLGARMFVESSVAIATRLGVSQIVIGLTLVAAGTSLPEVATSVVAALKGERDIAVGNVVGSNLFNLLGVLGVAGWISPDGVAVNPTTLQFDIPVMIAVAIGCLPVFLSGHSIERREGAVFLFFYLAYTTDTVLVATESPFALQFRYAMLCVALPIAILIVVLPYFRSSASSSADPETTSSGGNDDVAND